jgi:hypothetical protein
MGTISRGFSGRRASTDVKLPPGQYLTNDFQVLSAGPTPRVPLDQWQFTINEGTQILRKWDWKSFRNLLAETITVCMKADTFANSSYWAHSEACRAVCRERFSFQLIGDDDESNQSSTGILRMSTERMLQQKQKRRKH